MTKDQLLPKSLLQIIPPLYSQENEEDPIVQCKFFYPDGGWTWYVIEFDGDNTFYGLVDGFEKELGYFTLKELMENSGKLGLQIERDLYFKPINLKKLL